MNNSSLFLIAIPVIGMASFIIGFRIAVRINKGKLLGLPEKIRFVLLSIGLFFICLIAYIGIPKIIVNLKAVINNDTLTSKVVGVEKKDRDEGGYFYYPVVKSYVPEQKKTIVQKLDIGSSAKPIIGTTIDVVYNIKTRELYSVSLSSIAMTFFSLFLLITMVIVYIYACMYAFGTSIKPLVFQYSIISFFVFPSIFIGGISVTSYYLYLCFFVGKYEAYSWGTIITAICFLILLIAKTPVLVRDIKNKIEEISRIAN